MTGSNLSAMPRTGAPAMMGETPTTVADVALIASLIPATPRMVPTDTTGLLGGTMSTSQPLIASSTPGAGLCFVDSNRRDGVRGGRVEPYPVLLEVDCATATLIVGVIDHDVCLDSVVGHGQQFDTGLPAFAECRGHRRELIAGVEHLRTHQVGGDIAVTESEPARLDAVGRQLLLGVPGFVATTPAPVVIDPVTKGVHHGVEVRADAQAEHPHVIGGVGDNRDRVLLGVDDLAKPSEEAGAADSAGKYGDVHTGRLATSRFGAVWQASC